MSIFPKNSSKKPWWIVPLGVLTSITLAFTGTVSGSTTAQASETGPSISVSGKGCPKVGSSSWNRRMYIYDTAKAGSTICIAKMNNGQWGVNLNASYKFTKVNDYRFKAAIKITGHTSAHHVSTDGLQEWWITADADSAYLSGQGRYYMDEQGTAYYNSVPGKAFSISVRWWLTTTTRYWSDSLAQFVTTTDGGYVTMKTLKFKSVTVKKK